jgi:Fatty acid hydroxylase
VLSLPRNGARTSTRFAALCGASLPNNAVLFLWRLHAMHHSDPDADVTTAVRHHPIASLIAGSVYWVAVVALDIPAVVAPFHASAVFPAAAVTHGNMRVPERIEQWLQPAVITLDLHLARHSVAHDDANANFGAVLSLWTGCSAPIDGCRVPNWIGSSSAFASWRLPMR